ncbi:amino acid adenylation domain-containing protein [Myxococcus sp. XM-1-1-1]|uniref:non-ribosomal peptide synthetase n=1 Tax=Myxococcus sp. XM-1-1-1 TaxID=2874602 RepID=UPI001CBCDE42|nr:non-ribosomal peptide synthetase [Myxococcus sp. XM-1-1-1]MBZ4414793.1 amino acid adenylation domain-containing protein [Myxococcus sp. XM-1-1-1]
MSRDTESMSLEEKKQLLKRLLARQDAAPRVAAVQEPFALSYGQAALFHLHQSDPDNHAYHTLFSFRVHGPLDVEALRRAAEALVERHEVLRTTYGVSDDGRLLQRVQEKGTLPFTLNDSRGVSPAEVRRRLIEEVRKPFDLTTGPVARLSVTRVDGGEHLVVFTQHHVSNDARALQVLQRELLELYGQLVTGGTASLPAPRAQYRQFVEWEQALLGGPRGEVLERYWTERLAGAPPALELPTDKPRPAEQGCHGDTVIHELDRGLVRRAEARAREQGVTLYTFLLACFHVLLSRHTGQRDVLVGTPTNTLMSAEDAALQEVVGYAVNPVVVRSSVDEGLGFGAFARELQKRVLEALEHQAYPFPQLVAKLGGPRDASRPPVFQVMFNYLPVSDRDPLAMLGLSVDEGRTFQVHGLTVSPYVLPQQEAQFDVGMECLKLGERLVLALHYNADLFLARTARRLLERFECLLADAVERPSATCDALEVVSASEREELLLGLNPRPMDWVDGPSMVDLVEEQVRRTPDAVALSVGDTHLTYRELNARANRLAHYLRAHHGAGPDVLVGLMVDRTEWLLIGTLGILKSGAAYVPIDPAYPAERVRYLLQDSSSRVLLTEPQLLETARQGSPAGCVDITTARGDSDEDVAHRPGCEDLAYVIYTSGSTGRPKGTLIEHHSAVSFLRWCQTEFRATDFDVTFFGTSNCFDLSIFEMFYTLSVGRRVRLLRNSLQISEYLDSESRILVNTVPSVVKELLAAGADLGNVTVLNMAGEPIPQSVMSQLEGLPIQVRNLYGPSEDTTYSTCYRFPGDDPKVLIGKPLANTRVYILDKDLRLVPRGVPGELCLSGDGLARGYLDRPDLTAERFVPDPFMPGRRMYRTGDVAQWRADGNLDYLGRRDDQVKLNGYRIELGEIEVALSKHPATREVLVLARPGPSRDMELVAWLVCSEKVEPRELRAFLEQRLPRFMVPGHFVFLDAFPLTPNGKIDKKALAAPVAAASRSAMPPVAPRSELERALHELWGHALRGAHFGIDDNFFDVGGSSLHLTQIHMSLQRRLGRKMPMTELYRFPTIRALAEYLDRGPEKQAEPSNDERAERLRKQEQFFRARKARRS